MFYSTKEFHKYYLVKVLHMVLKVSVRQHLTHLHTLPKRSFFWFTLFRSSIFSLTTSSLLYNCIMFGRQEKKKMETYVQQEKHFWGDKYKIFASHHRGIVCNSLCIYYSLQEENLHSSLQLLKWRKKHHLFWLLSFF